MTVMVYGIPCSSTRQAKEWLNKYEVPFVMKNIMRDPLTIQELQFILSRTLEGTDEIISTRSKIYKDLDLNMDLLPLQQLLKLIQEHPKLLRSPILIDEKRFQVGYHEDDIRQFLPRKTRKRQWIQWKKLQLADGTI
ncbi:transcriptional regulator Spx [Lentibacillus sp. N15]|uniref:transcriptional regulator Spx n=1 Tax=Lentibacillus songyuanensis TaxID=3136161 RepID=UPI0031BAD34A